MALLLPSSRFYRNRPFRLLNFSNLGQDWQLRTSRHPSKENMIGPARLLCFDLAQMRCAAAFANLERGQFQRRSLFVD